MSEMYDDYLKDEAAQKLDVDDLFSQVSKQMKGDAPEGTEPPAEAKTEPPAKEDKQPPAAQPPASDEKASDKKAEPEQKPHKTEENRANAERRRQNEQRIAEAALKNSPEYKLAQTLAKASGKPIETLLLEMEALQYAESERQAGREVTPEEARRVAEANARASAESARAAQTQDELNTIGFERWQLRMDKEQEAIKAEHPYLTDEELEEARNATLRDYKNPDMPLETAVYAMYGKKIADGIREKARTDALAEASGRKASATPEGKRGDDVKVLNANQQLIAKKLGLSEADYIKYM